jgi:STE24 endopeptidase
MKEIHPLLDKEKQKQAKQYEKENRILGLVSLGLSLFILLGFYFSGMSYWLAQRFPGQSIIWTFLFYFVIFLSILIVFGLPLDYYISYVHEHKWKFSNYTRKTWSWEKAKSFLVSLLLMIIVLALLFWIMAIFPKYWWLITGVAMAFVSVIFATLIPVVILPIFNKYSPIKNKELVSALEKILARGGLKSSGFFKEDMSKQTKKENAFLAGLGKTRRVVLGDNLLDNMTVPEIESIIAHEVGHYKYRHIWKNILIGTMQQLIVFFIINQIMGAVFPQFLTSTRVNLTLFPILAIFMGAVSMLLFAPLSNAISRCFEKQADDYALNIIKEKKSFLTAMAGLADRNLANAYPEWWMKILYYSHPPIGERLANAEKD